MNPNEPASYLRRVLLVVSGMSPQILTETLWALTQSRHPGFIPTEIRMLTTAGGYRNARKRLLEEGHFARFCNEYEVQPPCFDVDQIEIIRDSLGLPLEDIRTPEENSAAADHITEIIRQYTLDDHCALQFPSQADAKPWAITLVMRYRCLLGSKTASRMYWFPKILKT